MKSLREPIVLCNPKTRPILFGQAAGAKAYVTKHMRRRPGCKFLARVGRRHFIFKVQQPGGGALYFRDDNYLIVVACGRMVAAVRLDDRQQDTVVLFEVAITHTL